METNVYYNGQLFKQLQPGKGPKNTVVQPCSKLLSMVFGPLFAVTEREPRGEGKNKEAGP